MRKRMILSIFLLLFPTLLFSGKIEPYIGWESNPLTTGISIGLRNESLLINASVQYPIVASLVLAVLDKTWLYPVFLWISSVEGRIPITDTVGLSIGPQVYIVTKDVIESLLISYNVQLGIDFFAPQASHLWSISLAFPIYLQGQMIHSDIDGSAWAYDEFGFAVIPSVRVHWKL